jgi:hypothetical protein
MSEYSTKELIYWVKTAVARLVVGEKRNDFDAENEIRDAIIAKLRAVDKLCEAAKEAQQELAFIYLQLMPRWDEKEKNEHYPIAINLGKAIADYENPELSKATA